MKKNKQKHKGPQQEKKNQARKERRVNYMVRLYYTSCESKYPFLHFEAQQLSSDNQQQLNLNINM